MKSNLLTPTSSGRSSTRNTVEASSQELNPDEVVLLERHLPLVRAVVNRIKLRLPAHVEADDLHSVGVTGLIAAVRRFDSAQDNTFGAYATLRIRGAVLDELRRLDWCPRRARAKSRQIRDAVGELEQRFGRVATDAELSKHLGLEPQELARWQAEVRPITIVPIDQPVGDAEGTSGSLHELIADDNCEHVGDSMEQQELKAMLVERISEMPETPKKVLAMYYFENMRLAEIAEVFGLTESRICQIHGQALQSLRKWILRARES
ncbi:FliA/WhiG family RNA polymerase sigma factor [Synoicihabitans lomoniglobus]|uniref:FliA/WhiG family RNA polymerase sigma factor n=1 Tax=Synoicihabitans lomoniglobus TaxID=2909285 RepID=A0AAE9ZXT5_9BACT|nr:FliA/WhiG family RNA polymerase sigma factor [Opitutaceae bacterium LMO-M01]WED63178.1 FliA/WhiG family RNA polymerase sigma factor [Opitutaceae bacterium LMO-M01]